MSDEEEAGVTMGGRNRILLTSVAAVLLLASVPAASADQGAVPPETIETLFFTGETGSSGHIEGVLLMSPAGPTSGPTPADVQVPLLEPLGLSDDQISWYTPTPMGEDRIITDTVEVEVYFSLQVQAATDATVRLYALEPNGNVRLLAEETRMISITSTLPQPETFTLRAADGVLPKDAVPKVEVQVDGASVLTTVEYGTEDAPSAITLFPTRTLDSDSDGLGDTFEREVTGTDPFDDDTDGDGFDDEEEVLGGSDPLDRDDLPDHDPQDPDRDGLPTPFEEQLGTDPDVADTDGDGYSDGLEFQSGSDPLDPGSTPQDRDGDGIPDGFEDLFGTDPSDPDSDGDGIPDGEEDSDGDGLTDEEEIEQGTDPHDPDTDDDGVDDGDEVAAGDNPRSDRSRESVADNLEPYVGGGMALASGGIIAFALAGRYGL